MFPTPYRAKSLVWYTSPLMPGPLAFGSLVSLYPTPSCPHYTRRGAACSMSPGLCADVPSAWMSCPLSLITSDWHILTHHSRHGSMSFSLWNFPDPLGRVCPSFCISLQWHYFSIRLWISWGQFVSVSLSPAECLIPSKSSINKRGFKLKYVLRNTVIDEEHGSKS